MTAFIHTPGDERGDTQYSIVTLTAVLCATVKRKALTYQRHTHTPSQSCKCTVYISSKN